MAHDSDKEFWAGRLREQLARVAALRAEAAADAAENQRRSRLRAWQAGRLAATYPDLLASERFGPAARFFLTDLYGPKDFSDRDREIERIVPTLVAMLPANAIRSIALAVELDALSERLDRDMAIQLAGGRSRRALDEAAYAAAYRDLDERAGRLRQIELIGEIGMVLDHLTHVPLMRTALRLMRKPAHMAGLGELHEFLERGFEAFRHMKGAEEFLATIDRRERELMQRLFDGSARPFDGLASLVVVTTRA